MFTFYGYFMGSWNAVIVVMLWLMPLDRSWCPDPPCLIYAFRSLPELDWLQSIQLNHLMNLTVFGTSTYCSYSFFYKYLAKCIFFWLKPFTAASLHLNCKRAISYMVEYFYNGCIIFMLIQSKHCTECLLNLKKTSLASLCPEKSVREHFCLIMIHYPKQTKQGVKTRGWCDWKIIDFNFHREQVESVVPLYPPA